MPIGSHPYVVYAAIPRSLCPKLRALIPDASILVHSLIIYHPILQFQPPTRFPHSLRSIKLHMICLIQPTNMSTSSCGSESQRNNIANKINGQVIEYLVKKGYNRTEQMLRQESANLDKDGRPIHDRAEDLGNGKYSRGFRMLSNWVDSNLDIYKVNLS
jgi:hypothetical protein